ncbi:MAG: PD40 domain-containing protein [Bryobacterales bacterium]|nr:PD40 domain-containing protein [Bryobacterales bacterium]
MKNALVALPAIPGPTTVRFGVFEADLASGELRKHGHRVKLQDQPFQVLSLLLRHPGVVVTRDELQRALWPDHTFVEFDLSLNTAVKKVRQALGDSSDNPRFIQTLPRKGYRFIASVLPVQPVAAPRNPAVGTRRIRVPAIAMLAGIAAAGAWLLTRPAGPGAFSAPVPLTSYLGNESHPAFSPDGARIAFQWTGQGGMDIWVKQTGTEEPVRLTTDPRPDFSPAWSPDGRHIAFCRFEDPNSTAVFVMPAIGGPEHKVALFRDSRDRLQPRVTWYPDGHWLAIPSRDREGEGLGIFLLSPLTGEKRRLTAPGVSTNDNAPAFSPDGRRLAFIRARFAESDVYVQSLSLDLVPSGEPRRLSPGRRWTTSAAWTPDGNDIVYSSGQWNVGGFSLWRIASTGSTAPRRLEFATEQADSPAISRQGSLVYARTSFDTNVWSVDLAAPGAAAGPSKPFIASTRKDGNPQFSPDGKRIAFDSDRGGSLEIWTCDHDGSNAAPLTSMQATMTGGARWSPDGERIVFDSTRDGQFELYVIRSHGGPATRLTNHPAVDALGNWSRDGRWIYFVSNRSGQWQVWKMPDGGGEPVQVTRKGGYVAFESSDGRFLYYSRSGTEGGVFSSVLRIPVEGGDETQVLDAAMFLSFAVTEKGIYFIPGPDSEHRYSVRFLDFAGGRSRPVLTLPAAPHPGLAVSPDGRTLLYTRLDRSGSDLMLVENFR